MERRYVVQTVWYRCADNSMSRVLQHYRTASSEADARRQEAAYNNKRLRGGLARKGWCFNIVKVQVVRGSMVQDNPVDSKTKDALIATGVLVGGFTLFGVMLAMLPKKKQEPKPEPSEPKGLPVSLNEPLYFVHQRLIDNLDTKAARCTLSTFVAALPKSAAEKLARELTTRAPVGGSGNVAVAVPGGVVVAGSDCKWRRQCFADGSCIGVLV